MTWRHLLSSIFGFLANKKLGVVTRWAIKVYSRFYQVNLDEMAAASVSEFASFNDFFTRALKRGIRPIADGVVSPVDGTVSQIGTIDGQTILQAKGIDYTVAELLQDEQHAFSNGSFLTAYLSPKDYHRVHMPIAGKLLKMTYIPGDLYPVKTAAVNKVNKLFAINERAVFYFETAFGVMAYIMIGALNVGSIETVWHGLVTPPYKKQSKTWRYNGELEFAKGAEIGRFRLGSSVILLLPEQAIQWCENYQAGSALKMGVKIAD